jgi:hypothetical protein
MYGDVHTVLDICLYYILVVVVLQLIPVVIYLLAMSHVELLDQLPATVEICIQKATIQ